MKFFAASLGRFRKSPVLGDDSTDRIPVLSASNQLAPNKTDSTISGSAEVNPDKVLPSLTVDRRQEGMVVELSAPDPHQPSLSFAFAPRLIELLDEERPEVLYVDLAKYSRLSSEMLNQLIQVNCHARSKGARLVISSLSRPLVDVFRLTRLDRLFELSASTDGEALA
jgi:anti-anti-sigma regulatory factor